MGDWFQQLFGTTERDGDVTEFLKVSGGKMTSSVNEEEFEIGRFETPSLGELRKRGAKHTRTQVGGLAVQIVGGDISNYIREFPLSVIQAASQFNSLEFVGPTVTPEQGVTCYAYDRTQGPACSIACGPATVYRNYFVEVEYETKQGVYTQLGQSKKHQIDNLKDISVLVGNVPDGRFYSAKGGYTMAKNKGLKALNNILGELDADTVRAALRIGVHEDVQVTSYNWGRKQIRDPEHIVTQVFGSACSVQYSRNDSKHWAPFARLILEASYEATLWAALEHAERHEWVEGSNIVFLTQLGGGVFGNSFAWIADAMRHAFEKFKDVDLDVRLVVYAPPVDPRIEQVFKDFRADRKLRKRKATNREQVEEKSEPARVMTLLEMMMQSEE